MKNRDNIRIYGGDAGGVWVADKGTTGPTDLDTPSAPWAELGWMSDNGLDLEQAADQKEFNAWQGGTLVKVVTTGGKRTLKFECLEETAVVLGLAYPGLAFTVSNGLATGTVPGSIPTQEKAFVADAVDSIDGYTKRFVIPTGTIDPSNTVAHKFDDMTVYAFSVAITDDFDIITDSPSIVGAPPAWQATHAYVLNDLVSVTGGILKCTTAGTSGSSAPTLPGSVGGTVTDGTATWTRQS